ncbi:MAG: CPBP family intramembrane glutamic endopeptidase [Sedimentisphaerales bacterium]
MIFSIILGSAAQTAEGFSAGELVFLSAAAVLLVRWLINTDFGTRALDGAEYRRNSMPDYLPFTIMFGWLMLTAFSSHVMENLLPSIAEWQQKFVIYSGFIAIEILVMLLILKIAKRYFEEGLRGFGIRFRKIFSDITAAAGIFIVVWPAVMALLYVVLFVGKAIVGPGFEIERNEGLAVLLENSQLSLRILMIFFAVVLTPIFEELVFRGLLQSYLRNINYGPWMSILIASILFSALHPGMHFPAIFVLSAAMGYAYEKSGSLLRPIFIHFLFNGVTIALALLGR